MKTWLPALCLFALFAASDVSGETAGRVRSGAPDYERNVDESYPIEEGARVNIRHSLGELAVKAGSGTEVRVEARIEVKGEGAREFGEQIRVSVDPEGSTFEIETEYPDQDEKGSKDFSFGVRLTVTLPPGHALAVNNAFGAIMIAGVEAPVAAEANCGSIEVFGIAGEVRLTSAFGNVTAKDCRGAMRVAGTNGSIEISGPSAGDLEVENRFGNVDVRDAQGNVAIEGGNGRIAVRNVAGDLFVKSSFGGVVAEEIGGACRVVLTNGTAALKEIEKDVDVQNAFGAISVSGAGGNVKAANKNGSIKAERLSYGQPGSDKGNRFDLSTSFGMIEIALPAPPSFRLDAATTFGRIKSEFDLPGKEKGITSERCSCTLGEGLAEVVLKTSNGAIEIKKKGNAVP